MCVANENSFAAALLQIEFFVHSYRRSPQVHKLPEIKAQTFNQKRNKRPGETNLIRI